MRPLVAGNTVNGITGNPRDTWLAFQALESNDHLLLTFKTGAKGLKALLERSTDSGNGMDGQWQSIQTRTTGRLLEKFELDAERGTWFRLRFDVSPSEKNPDPVTLNDVGLYRLRPGHRHDYWLVIGASIQAQSIRQDTFHRMVTDLYPGFDPVIFNVAVSGWKTDDLLAALPGFLEDHPYASYVCIHIGGNNVSANRPYPGGAEQIRTELESILRLIRDDGKAPILSRLSYRAYKNDPPVPPEENGSGPYVRNIYDPLIKEYCPNFFDFEAGRGRVDAYTWFKEHQDQLSGDGIHVNPKGAESWNRLWAREAGAVVYGQTD